VFSLKKSPLVIQNILSPAKKNIYLTFDDGPDPETTNEVLDLLKAEKWNATFFVIGHLAEKNLNLIQRMLNEGHSVMSHSVDHDYSHYFNGKEHLKTWLQNSLKNLSFITKQPQKVFRPPAGILTPPLLEAATELNIPLILWNHRFYDAVWGLSEKKLLKSVPKLKEGDIVLLHDRQSAKKRPIFLSALKTYIRTMKAQDFIGTSLSEDVIFQQLGGS